MCLITTNCIITGSLATSQEHLLIYPILVFYLYYGILYKYNVINLQLLTIHHIIDCSEIAVVETCKIKNKIIIKPADQPQLALHQAHNNGVDRVSSTTWHRTCFLILGYIILSAKLWYAVTITFLFDFSGIKSFLHMPSNQCDQVLSHSLPSFPSQLRSIVAI